MKLYQITNKKTKAVYKQYTESEKDILKADLKILNDIPNADDSKKNLWTEQEIEVLHPTEPQIKFPNICINCNWIDIESKGTASRCCNKPEYVPFLKYLQNSSYIPALVKRGWRHPDIEDKKPNPEKSEKKD